MGTGGDGLIAVDTARTNHTDGWLGNIHHTGLHRTGVAAEDDVLGHVIGIGLHKEGVLHVAGRMVGGKVHLREDMQVVFHFRTVGKGETHALENVDNLIGHNGYGMTGAKTNGVGRAGEVDVVVTLVGRGNLLAERIDMVGGSLLQFVNLHAHFTLLLGSNGAEVGHQ